MSQTIASRLDQVLERIARAAARANRDPAAITLVAVTKTHPPEIIAEAIAAGVRDLGENRVQEAALKIPALAAAYPVARWHLIGHLQRNKAKPAIELFDVIHSVDSLRLAETLNRHLQERAAGQTRARRMPILLQVNVSGESSKEGFDLPGGLANRVGLEALLPEVERIVALPCLEVRGLMTIAP
ncbi:MAG: YggS family pyridoxal phosphate-dependent enzyme, partial [Chloroflexaceae bacterium]